MIDQWSLFLIIILVLCHHVLSTYSIAHCYWISDYVPGFRKKSIQLYDNTKQTLLFIISSVLGEIGSCLSQFTAGCQLLLDRVNLERQKLLDIEQAEDLCDLEWIHSDVTQQITSADGNGAVMIVGYSISISKYSNQIYMNGDLVRF